MLAAESIRHSMPLVGTIHPKLPHNAPESHITLHQRQQKRRISAIEMGNVFKFAGFLQNDLDLSLTRLELFRRRVKTRVTIDEFKYRNQPDSGQKVPGILMRPPKGVGRRLTGWPPACEVRFRGARPDAARQ